MPTRQEYEKSSLASGEISPELHGATDLRAYQTGVAAQENFVTILEGIAVRRPGTRFVTEMPNEAQRGKLWPFRYSEGDYYMLLFNGGKMRVLRDAGYVSVGGAPFQASIPWSESELAQLRAAPLKNTLTFTSGTERIRVVTRIAQDNWTVVEYLPLNGPVEAQNLDTTKTVIPSATTGAITLAGSNGPFDMGMTGGVLRLDEANAGLTVLWTAGETIAAPSSPAPTPDGLFGSSVTSGALTDMTDGDETTAAGFSGTECYAGFHWNTPQTILNLLLEAQRTIGPNYGFTNAATALTLEIWGSTGAAPANSTAGTLLGSLTFVDNSSYGLNSLPLYVSSATQSWNNVWFRLRTSSGGSATFGVAGLGAYVPASGGALTLRRWGENIYQALAGGNSGSSPPVHDDGDASYGGITWRFRSKTYGFVRITGVTDTNTAAAIVITRLPDSATATSSYRWWPPSWSDGSGWPEIVLQHQQKFLFFRKNRLWITRPATVDDYAFTADTDSAIAATLAAPDDQSLPEIRWAASGGIVVIGTADIEWMLRAPASNDVLQAQTIDPIPDSLEGSMAQIPTKVDRGVIVVDATGTGLLYIKFDALTQQLSPELVSAAARHIPRPGVVAKAWQKHPHKILWLVLRDGTLAAVTFMPGEKIIAFHRHPMQNAFVEDIAAIPAIDDGQTEIYLIVRRTINGVVRRYVELLQPFFQPVDAVVNTRVTATRMTDAADVRVTDTGDTRIAISQVPKDIGPTAAGAWFVDCGLSYSGDPVTTISGLAHLENEVVAVFADGAMQQRKRVVNGAIDLDGPASSVVVGLPVKARILDLPRSLQLPGGSSRGKPQRATDVIVDVLNAGGGQVRMTHPKLNRRDDDDDTPFDDLVETGADDYGDPVKLFTGQIAQTVTDDGASVAVVEIVCDDAMPCSVRAIVPDQIVEGD
jgi:hypothetical protein